jgi:hypothetical protein
MGQALVKGSGLLAERRLGATVFERDSLRNARDPFTYLDSF